MWPIVDLHCDLLSFLAHDLKRTVDDPSSLASYPQMQAGKVSLQTLAIFTEGTQKAFSSGKTQLNVLQRLLDKQPQRYKLWDPSLPIQGDKGIIYVVPSFENAEGFSKIDLPIQDSLPYLNAVHKQFKTILYISLTWNGENRFGGGSGSKKGLKEDGKCLLEWMDNKKIAIDLSHSSDFLADDIFNYIDKHSLHIPVIASHSNARSIIQQDRNLPDSLAKEIFSRKGIIGLNFFAPFIGDTEHKLQEHIEHFSELGGKDLLCFGADFFAIEDHSIASLRLKFRTATLFFSNLANASCYPYALRLLDTLPPSQREGICYKNFQEYLKRTMQ